MLLIYGSNACAFLLLLIIPPVLFGMIAHHSRMFVFLFRTNKWRMLVCPCSQASRRSDAAARRPFVDVALGAHGPVLDLLVQEPVRVREERSEDDVWDGVRPGKRKDGVDAVEHECHHDQVRVVVERSEDAAGGSGHLDEHDDDRQANWQAVELGGGLLDVVIVRVFGDRLDHDQSSSNGQGSQRHDADHDDVHNDHGAAHIAAPTAAHVAALHACHWHGHHVGVSAVNLQVSVVGHRGIMSACIGCNQ
mmetsp:Transcript_27837/g.77999  ORF Transcript_27837/g.77999 Transcript_27837/m.77999 type:complete len:249 (+) Transcript_27837:29-775(+)